MAFSMQFTKMKSIFVPHIKQIPQWKEIYFDVQTLEMLSHICHKSNELIKSIRRKIQAYEKSINHRKKSQRQIRQISKMQKLCRCEFKLNLIIQESSSTFYKYCQANISVLFHFIQYKSHFTSQKLQRITHYSHVVQRSNPSFISLIQNLYIQVHYLLQLIKHNKQSLETTKSQYQLNLYTYELLDGSDGMRKVNRVEKVFHQVMDKLTRIYRIKREKVDRTQTIDEILTKPKQKTAFQRNYTFILGLSMGFLIVIFAAMNFFENYHDITIEQNPKFALQFPVWRGASSFVFYMWVLGFALLFMEKMNINYKLVLAIQDKTFPNSKSFLLDAQVSTTVLLIIFIVYMLKMGGVLDVSFNNFGHVMWLFLIVYYFVPLPFRNNAGKVYFLKQLAKIIVSPFVRCNRLMVFLTQLLISLNQPYTDFCYAVCRLNDPQSKCKQAADWGFGILVYIFLLRISQNLRLIQQAGWTKIPPFYGTFRASSGLIVTVISFFYRLHLNSTWLGIWLVGAAVSTTIAIVVDIKIDWGLLDGGLLRKKLTFFDRKYIYYTFMLLDTVFRTNWVLNVSPTLLTQFGIYPYYLVMIVTYIELFRRAIWSVFRVEYFHSMNCANFQAICVDTSIETQLQQKYSNWLPHDKKSILDKQVLKIRTSTQLELVKTGIQEQIQRKAMIRKTIQQFEKRFGEIEDSLDNQIS